MNLPFRIIRDMYLTQGRNCFAIIQLRYTALVIERPHRDYGWQIVLFGHKRPPLWVFRSIKHDRPRHQRVTTPE